MVCVPESRGELTHLEAKREEKETKYDKNDLKIVISYHVGVTARSFQKQEN